MTTTLLRDGHRLVLVREENGVLLVREAKEVRPGENALAVAVAFGFEDDPGLPEGEVCARALSFLEENVGRRLDGPVPPAPAGEETTGRRLDASMQRLLQLRETRALLDEAAPELGRLLAGDPEALDGFDAAHAALGARIEDAVGEIEDLAEDLTGRIGRLVGAGGGR